MRKRYRCRNVTKNSWFYVWGLVEPTEDPNNPGDEIDTDSIAIVEEEKPIRVIQYSLGTDAKNSDKYYKAESRIVFPGELMLGSISVLGFVGMISDSSDGRSASIRVYDSTNQVVIAEQEFSNIIHEIIDFNSFSNLSGDEAMWEIQIKRNGKQCDVLCDCVYVVLE